jgi:DNA adenine methylase
VARMRDGIHLSNLDALAFLRANRFPAQSLIYLDPPYYVAGKDLYLNAYRHRDHEILSRYVRGIKRRWVVSYDDVSSVRDLYRGYRSRRLELLHNARVSRVGREVMFFADDVRIPQRIAGDP